MAWYDIMRIRHYTASDLSEADSGDLSTLVDLNVDPTAVHASGYYATVEEDGYLPEPPGDENVVVEGAIVKPRYGNATDPIHLLLTGDDIDKLKTLIGEIDRALGLARRYEEKRYGRPVYLEVGRSEAADGYYISRIKDGRISHDSWATIGTAFRIEVTLYVTREYYFESLSDAALTVTNGHGTGSSGVTIYPQDDSGNDDWVSFTPGGDLPTPAEVRLTNSYNNASRVKRIFVGLRYTVASEAFKHVWEGESSSGVSALPVGPDTTLYSNGQYGQAAWTGTTEAKLFDWTLATADMDGYMGRVHRALLRFVSQTYSDLYLRLKVEYEGASIWTGRQFLVEQSSTHALQELCNVRLPPHLVRSIGLYPLHLCVYGQRATAGSHTLDLDFAALMPLDGYRVLTPRGLGLPYNWQLVDNGRTGELYSIDPATGKKVGGYMGRGKPLMLWPGVTNHLFVLWDDDTGGAPIARTMSIIVKCRKRRRSIGV